MTINETEQYVNWDGLRFYDGRIKDHIDNVVSDEVNDVNSRLDHETNCLHNQVTSIENRVTLHDSELSIISGKLSDIDPITLKQEVTTHVVNHFDETIETTVLGKIDTVIESDDFNSLVAEKVEEAAGTTSSIRYGTF